ncbi:MAG: alanine--tRNA ligase [Rhodospirillaceae bacterium]|jgi:alanyl-tRNA synthetase|nr:alanine--tRNA ligase [Rhodospirillaceae bacterium]
MSSTNDIRAAFLEFFGKNDHSIQPSSPLVPHNDPTLLFTNAGMVQFKNVFTGLEKRPYSRATTSQKCVRAGGKHNDLENVGYTARHHTFFEMLGNFSFGDYFKEHAIELAWNLITKEFGIDKDRLLVTVYHEDDDAFDLWRKIAGLPDERIIRIATSDNFWAMGDTGPCGPCSEIFYDHGDHIEGGPPGSPNEDGDRFIEIWNLVFMQYEQIDSATRNDLPRPSIDTGMGLERIAALMQGVHDNYDTDTLRALVVASAEIAGVAVDGEHNVSNRVIADHLRASSFLMADGVLPSNEGRGYVLRRIMRRAMRHAHMMGSRDPMVHRLVPALIDQMGKAYPELGRAEALITETLELEETRFKQTLDRGLKLLFEETDKLGEGEALAGDIAFRLYDTFGFPLDLTEDVLRGQGRSVDTDGFNSAMQRQREDARKAWSGSGEAAEEGIWFDIRERHGATEFLGYTTEVAEGQVKAIVDGKGQEVSSASAGEDVSIVTNQTPFYGESGGQQGDSGVLFTSSGTEIAIRGTQKRLGDLHIHQGSVTKGTITVGDVVEARVDQERRGALRGHHSATHLLHAALREHLGEHVTQKGSMVAADRLRFDVSHPKAVSADELTAVSRDVNREVRRNTGVTTRLMTPDEAIEAGAMALFGEKYGDEVRVVTMGGSDNSPYSVELCGGTHVYRTGDIGFFKIVSESAVAAGIRRIEAVTGQAAIAQMNETEALLHQAASALNVPPAAVPDRVQALVDDRKKLETELSDLRRKLATGGGGSAGSDDAREVGGIKLVAKALEGIPARELKSMADDLKNQVGSGVVAICGTDDGKASLVVGVTEDLTDRIDAVTLVRAGAAALGGKGGGGRPDMAQAGGPDAGKAEAALAAIEEALAAAG